MSIYEGFDASQVPEPFGNRVDPEPRPEMPVGETDVWYRGWEVGWDQQREFYTGEGYVAYKGGCDLGAPEVTSGSWVGILDAIDDEEDDA